VNFVLAAIYAGLISVDRFAAFNFMLSRPIVIGFVLSIIFGNHYECFYIGLVFEALGLIDVPFGTRVPKEDSFGAFAACMLFIILPISHSDDFILGFLLTIVLIFPVTFTTLFTRTLNKQLLQRQQAKGKVRPGQLLALGLLISFIRGVVVYSAGTLILYSLYTFIHGHLESNFNLLIFVLMVFTFLSGYILRFLTVHSSLKYIVFGLGLLVGWVIL